MSQQTSQADRQVGSRIEAELQARRCSKRSAARKIQMSEWAFGRRVRGEIAFRMPELRGLATFLEVPIAALLEDPTPESETYRQPSIEEAG